MMMPRILLGFGLIGLVITVGAMGRSWWAVLPLGAVFAVALVHAKPKVSRGMFFEGGAFAVALRAALTLGVEIALVAFLFLLGRGLGWLIGSTAEIAPFGAADAIIAVAALALSVLGMEITRWAEGGKDPLMAKLSALRDDGDPELLDRVLTEVGGEALVREEDYARRKRLLEELDDLASAEAAQPIDVFRLSRKFAELKDERAAVDALLTALEREATASAPGAASVRRAAITALRYIAEDKTADLPKGMVAEAGRGVALGDPDDWVRHDAVWLIQTLGDADAAFLASLRQAVDAARVATGGDQDARDAFIARSGRALAALSSARAEPEPQ